MCWYCWCSGLCEPIEVLIIILCFILWPAIILNLSIWLTNWFIPYNKKFHLGKMLIGIFPSIANPKDIPICISSATGSSKSFFFGTFFNVLDIAVPGTSTAWPIKIVSFLVPKKSIDLFISLKYFFKTELSGRLQHVGTLICIYNK